MNRSVRGWVVRGSAAVLLTGVRLGALAVLGAGCSSGGPEAGNPLTGTWQAAVNTAAYSGTVAVTLAADGTFTEDVTATKVLGVSCSGTETTTGLTWSSTGTTLTVGGQAACSGSFTCGATTAACSSSTGLTAGTCSYTLSSNNGTLTLSSCTNPVADITFTRM
jgi:hypothetical protein